MGLNHPILGTTTIFNNTWYHAAVTFDGRMTWRLYLNGSLENTLVVGHLPRWDNTSPLGLGTSMTTGGTAQGFFDGTLDEVRIWNYARSEAEIQSAMNSQISDPTTGLAARWSLNEASGTTVSGSAGTAVNGSIYPIASPTGWNWTQDAPFNINIWPDQPTNVEPEDGGDVANPPTLRVTVNDPENASMEVCFFGCPAPAAPDFTVAVIPDSQNYSASLNNGTPAMFNAQMQYIVDQRVSDNMAFVTHVGDVVNTGSNATEWANADAAYDILEGANPELIPYGIAMGNHDMDVYNDPTQTTNYNANFGYSRFAGRSYYKGAYDADGTPPPPDNDNNVEFFGQGGLDFMAIHLENDDSPEAPVLAWADSLLANNPTRRGIVVFHTLFDTTSGCTSPLSSAGDAIYAALSDRPNLFLMLGGHLSGENYCSVSRAGMNPVSLMLVDYQSRTNGGNGWMRLLEFSPAQDKIFAKTYSPTLGSFETDANSQFEISYPMGGSEAYTPLGCQNVASGGTASMLYEGLELGKIYEWYVTINDGARTTTSSTFDFVTIDPTAAVLADFNATAMDLSVSIDFKTADETDLIGFNLYRADKQDGARIRAESSADTSKKPRQDGG